MSTATNPPVSDAGSALASSVAIHDPDDLYRTTVDQYERLAQTAALQDRKVELINGWLVKKMTTKPPHVVAVDATREAIAATLPPGWWLREEKPVEDSDFDEPEPDISVVRAHDRTIVRTIRARGTSTSSSKSQTLRLPGIVKKKCRLMRGAGVPTYWIINLVDRQLEVYTSPASDGYHVRQVLTIGTTAEVFIDGARVGSIKVAYLIT